MAKKDGSKATPRLRFPEFRGTGKLHETTIGEISNQITAGATPDTSEKSYWNGKYRWMNSGELNLKRVYEVQGRITEQGLNNSSTKMIPERCVLIGLAGQGKTRGTVAMNMVPLCTNQSIAAIFPNEALFDSDFLYQNLDNRYEELRRLSAGGEGRGGLNLQIIRTLKIVLPPLPEQKKIADCLTSLDELIAAQARKVEALKDHKRGLMQELFPREGETVPRLRFPEFGDGAKWGVRELGLMTSKVGSGITPLGGDKNYLPQGRPFVRSQNVGWGELLLDDVAFIDEATHRSFDATEIQVSDVLLNITGASIGRSAIANSQIAGGNVNQHVCIIRTKTNELNPIFLNQFLISEIGQKQIDGFQAGGNRQGLNFAQIRSFEIPLPSSEREQQRIASCLSSLDTLVATESQKLDLLKTHKKGLMQQLFPAAEGD